MAAVGSGVRVEESRLCEAVAFFDPIFVVFCCSGLPPRLAPTRTSRPRPDGASTWHDPDTYRVASSNRKLPGPNCEPQKAFLLEEALQAIGAFLRLQQGAHRSPIVDADKLTQRITIAFLFSPAQGVLQCTASLLNTLLRVFARAC